MPFALLWRISHDHSALVQHGIPIAQQPTSYRPMVPAGMAFEAEIEINDFHQHARWKVRTLSQSTELDLLHCLSCLSGQQGLELKRVWRSTDFRVLRDS